MRWSPSVSTGSRTSAIVRSPERSRATGSASSTRGTSSRGRRGIRSAHARAHLSGVTPGTNPTRKSDAPVRPLTGWVMSLSVGNHDAMSAIDGWTRGSHTFEGTTHPTYRKGTGPGVVMTHEIPGMTTDVVAFADEVVAAGHTVVMPHLF